jgi:hypothetical protein
MADKDGKNGERQMLFDLQGRRRKVVKVVYAILALLMGLSLLLIAGPLPFGDIFGAQDAQELAREQAEEREDRIQVKLAKEPENPELLASLARAQVAAGSSLAEQTPTGEIALTVEARQQFEQAASTWTEYLELTDEPSPNLAQQMAGTLLSLAQTAPSGDEAEANIKAWAQAQQIVADQRPSIGSLSTLALYLPFTFDYAAAKEAAVEAKKLASSKFQRQQIDNQLEESEKRAREFQKSLKEEEQLNKQLQESQQGGEAGGADGSFQNPFGVGAGATE